MTLIDILHNGPRFLLFWISLKWEPKSGLGVGKSLEVGVGVGSRNESYRKGKHSHRMHDELMDIQDSLLLVACGSQSPRWLFSL